MKYRAFSVIAVAAIGVLLALLLSGRAHTNTSDGSAPFPESSKVTTSSDLGQLVGRQDSKATLVSYKPPLPPSIPGEIHEPGCLASEKLDGTKPTNAWEASGSKDNRYLHIIVCAGALRDDPDTGYLFISRVRLPGTKDRNTSAYVPLSGAVRIMYAPLGWKATRRVWDGPRIWFKGETGTYGYLDLSDNSVHVTGGPVAGVCPDGTVGKPPECVVLRPYLDDFRVTPKVRWKSPGESFTFLAEVRNVGTAPGKDVNLCVGATVRFIKGDTWDCFVFDELPVGEIARHRFRFDLTNHVKPGRKYTLDFLATSPINAGYVTWPGARETTRTIRILK